MKDQIRNLYAETGTFDGQPARTVHARNVKVGMLGRGTGPQTKPLEIDLDESLPFLTLWALITPGSGATPDAQIDFNLTFFRNKRVVEKIAINLTGPGIAYGDATFSPLVAGDLALRDGLLISINDGTANITKICAPYQVQLQADRVALNIERSGTTIMCAALAVRQTNLRR